VVEVVPLTPRPTSVEMTIECTPQENTNLVKFGNALEAYNLVCNLLDVQMNRKWKPVFFLENLETKYSFSSSPSVSIYSNQLEEFCDCACNGVVGKHDIILIHFSSEFRL